MLSVAQCKGFSKDLVVQKLDPGGIICCQIAYSVIAQANMPDNLEHESGCCSTNLWVNDSEFLYTTFEVHRK